MKKTINRMVSLFALCAIVFSAFAVAPISVPASAASANQEEIDAVNKQIAELEKKIAEDKKNLSSQNSLKANLDAKVSAMQKKINLCNQQIAETRAQIALSEKTIAQKNEDIAQTKEAFKKRIRSLYTSNTSSGLQILLGAESFSDLLTRTELTKCISAQDTAIVEKLVETIAVINKEIEDNNVRYAQLDKDLAQLKKDKATLDYDVKELNAAIKQTNSNITSAQNDVNRLEQYIDNLMYGGEIDAAFSGIMVWPAPGVYRVTTEFNVKGDGVHTKEHKGLDIAGPRGSKIVSAASGVVTSTYTGCSHYSKLSDGCGGGFGNHVRVSHGWYGGKHFLSIYGHLDAVTVSNGAHVNGNQQIGKMGSSGRSTGSHLHFGVAVKSTSSTVIYNSEWVNPRKYLR